MTLVSLPSPIIFPGNLQNLTATPTLNTLVTVSSAGHYGSYVFCARENMTISHVGFRAGTATGSPTVEARIETLDASGLPSGTLWDTNTNGTSGTITSNSNPVIALTASASITKGQTFCVKIAYASGTSQVIQGLGSYIPFFGTSNTPYTVTNTGSPTKAGGTNGMLVVLGSSSTTFYQMPGTIPFASLTDGSFNNTNGQKRGLLFTPPMSCRVIGIRYFVGNAAGDYNAGIYTGDASGTELSSSATAFDGDISAANTVGVHQVYFDNPVTLSANTAYRAAIEPTSATNCNVNTVTMPSSDYLTASPGGSSQRYTSLSSGTWTDSSTKYPLLDVLIDQVDDGTGSGGGGQRVFGG